MVAAPVGEIVYVFYYSIVKALDLYFHSIRYIVNIILDIKIIVVAIINYIKKLKASLLEFC